MGPQQAACSSTNIPISFITFHQQSFYIITTNKLKEFFLQNEIILRRCDCVYCITLYNCRKVQSCLSFSLHVTGSWGLPSVGPHIGEFQRNLTMRGAQYSWNESSLFSIHVYFAKLSKVQQFGKLRGRPLLNIKQEKVCWQESSGSKYWGLRLISEGTEKSEKMYSGYSSNIKNTWKYYII